MHTSRTQAGRVGAILLAIIGIAADSPPRPIEIDSAVLAVIEQVEVPAQEPGVLTRLQVREGALVKVGEVLAQIEETEAQLAEAKARGELEIAKQEAANELKIRIAQKGYEVAGAELRRAKESVSGYPKSVSATEMDRLQLTAAKMAVEVDQARHDRELARLKVHLREIELQQAQRKVQRRQILAPRDGVIVQIHRHPGEWVEPGEKVLRLLRLDRLRCEGFVAAADARERILGAKVKFHLANAAGTPVQFEGVVSYVSPEVNPVNSEVRIWAEVDNRGLQLRPGQRGSLTILLP